MRLTIFAINVLITLLLVVQANAQIFNNTTGQDKSMVGTQKIKSDSTGFAEKGLDHSVSIYALDKNYKRVEYDTSLTNSHQIGLLNAWQRSLGNTGTAYQSLQAEIKLSDQYSLLPNRWDAYRYTLANALYYNTTKPFSEVRYSTGSGQEQLLELFYTQNISPVWNFSAHYRKINSLGFFKGQRSNIDNFKFLTNYQSKNKRYQARGAFLYNKVQQDENLGIVSDTFLSNPSYRNHSIIPVNAAIFSTAKNSPILNYRRDVNVNYQHEYSLGKTRVSYDEDSIKTTNFKPVLTFGNAVYLRSERYCFQYNSLDSNVHKAFQQTYFNLPYAVNDTLLIQYDNTIVGTSVSAEGNVYIKDKVFSLLAGLGAEYQNIGGQLRSQNAVNNYVFASLNNFKSQDSNWVLQANMRLYYTGMAQGNLSFEGVLSKQISDKLGTIGVEAQQYVQQPFYVSENLMNDSVLQRKKLNAQINTSVGGFYKNPRLQFSVQLRSLLFNNLIYGTDLQPNYQNYSKAISVQQLIVRKGFELRSWKISNQVMLQVSPTSTPINVPLLTSFHRFAYQDYLFKKKMQVSMGVDVYYNTPYTSDGYQPVFQSFNPQRITTYSMIPRVHPFFNFKIKRFRGSVSFDQLQHFLVKNNFNYLDYPAQNQLFRFGLRWIFIN